MSETKGLNEEMFEIMKINAFHADGAVVVDGLSGIVIASGWFVGDISRGGTVGGARTRASKAIAKQAGGCFVIKCSEDSAGELDLYLGVSNSADDHGDSVDLLFLKFDGEVFDDLNSAYNSEMADRNDFHDSY